MLLKFCKSGWKLSSRGFSYLKSWLGAARLCWFTFSVWRYTVVRWLRYCAMLVNKRKHTWQGNNYIIGAINAKYHIVTRCVAGSMQLEWPLKETAPHWMKWVACFTCYIEHRMTLPIINERIVDYVKVRSIRTISNDPISDSSSKKG